MSDFVPCELWKEIIKHHWEFLAAEESMQKLEERKKLEGYLKDFLSIVPHDRKFFLPETEHVLRKTILEMDDFAIYKTIIGFESISQYANNLFSKPWRKEYRVIKMYSGFFQHEVKSNILDSVKLFEAMGYQQVAPEILALDGQICSDQVTNVSRDALIACVECTIIKTIYSGLTALGIQCSWQDVFHYRVKNTGGSSQAVKDIAYEVKERHFRKDILYKPETAYVTIKHVQATAPLATPMMPHCQNCVPLHLQQLNQHQHFSANSQCAIHSGNQDNNNHVLLTYNSSNNNLTQQQPNRKLCNATNSQLLASYPASNYQQTYPFAASGSQQQPQPDPHSHAHLMSHSRSLEHYHEPQPPPALPHRHSFDQQQQQQHQMRPKLQSSCMLHSTISKQHAWQHHYESPQYDCIDGRSFASASSSSGNASYAMVAPAAGAASSTYCDYSAACAQAYNVSGNRYPLPHNISNQFQSHYDESSLCGGPSKASAQRLAESCADNNDQYHRCNYPSETQTACRQSPLPSQMRHHQLAGSKDFAAHRQRSFPPDQQHIIDFDDRARLTEHDFHAQLYARATRDNSFDYEREWLEESEQQQQQLSKDRHNSVAALEAAASKLSITTYAQPKDAIDAMALQKQSAILKQSSEDGDPIDYIYTNPTRSMAVDSLLESTVGDHNINERTLRCQYARTDLASVKATEKYLRDSKLENKYYSLNKVVMKELSQCEEGAPAEKLLTNGRQNSTNAEILTELLPPVREMAKTTTTNYDSVKKLDEFRKVYKATAAIEEQRSPTQAVKNQDGVGSFESWDSVFQNLSHAGHYKCVEKVDDSKESRQLDSLNLATEYGGASASNGGTDKRRPNQAATAKTVVDQKSHTAKPEKSILKQSNINPFSKSGTKSKPQQKFTQKATSNANNNYNSNKQQQQKQQQPQQQQQQQQKHRPINRHEKPPPRFVSAPLHDSGANEWSCQTCTFLNPANKTRCEMCDNSRAPRMSNAAAVAMSNRSACV